MNKDFSPSPPRRSDFGFFLFLVVLLIYFAIIYLLSRFASNYGGEFVHLSAAFSSVLGLFFWKYIDLINRFSIYSIDYGSFYTFSIVQIITYTSFLYFVYIILSMFFYLSLQIDLNVDCLISDFAHSYLCETYLGVEKSGDGLFIYNNVLSMASGKTCILIFTYAFSCILFNNIFRKVDGMLRRHIFCGMYVFLPIFISSLYLLPLAYNIDSIIDSLSKYGINLSGMEYIDFGERSIIDYINISFGVVFVKLVSMYATLIDLNGRFYRFMVRRVFL